VPSSGFMEYPSGIPWTMTVPDSFCNIQYENFAMLITERASMPADSSQILLMKLLRFLLNYGYGTEKPPERRVSNGNDTARSVILKPVAAVELFSGACKTPCHIECSEENRALTESTTLPVNEPG